MYMYTYTYPLRPLGRLPRADGWKINYPEVGYPEFCQLMEQEPIDPNKALGQSIKSHRGTSICTLRILTSTE